MFQTRNVNQKVKHYPTVETLKQEIKFIDRQDTNITSVVDIQDCIPRVQGESFREEYEAKNLPVVIQGLTAGWREFEWQDIEQYSDQYFRVGIDDDGNYLKIPLSEYLSYLNNKDHNPLYLFDGDIPEQMLQQYTVPSIFNEDYLSYLGEQRPQYRWFLIGPQRSGSMVHIDPYATAAWNTLLHGKKRWVMFHPDTPKQIVKGTIFYSNKQVLQDEVSSPIDYFEKVVPQIKSILPDNQYYDFIQHPHETVFVPHGWWHAVINLEHTMAITQNYVGSINFQQFWVAFNSENPGLSSKYFQILRQVNPTLYEMACSLNNKYNLQFCDEIAQGDSSSQCDSLEEFHNIDYDYEGQ